jgi:hypothetical protein
MARSPALRLAHPPVPGLGLFWLYGPILVFVVFPPLDLAVGDGRAQPARQRDQVARTGARRRDEAPQLPTGGHAITRQRSLAL